MIKFKIKIKKLKRYARLVLTAYWISLRIISWSSIKEAKRGGNFLPGLCPPCPGHLVPSKNYFIIKFKQIVICLFVICCLLPFTILQTSIPYWRKLIIAQVPLLVLLPTSTSDNNKRKAQIPISYNKK